MDLPPGEHARAAPARPGPAHRSPDPRARWGLHPGHWSPPATGSGTVRAGPQRRARVECRRRHLPRGPGHARQLAPDRRPDLRLRPGFSRDGTRFSFLRGGPTDCGQPDCGLILVVANADGTDVRELTPGVPMLDGLDWSPDGSQLAILTAAEDGQGHGLAIVNADGSGMRTLDLARPVHLPSWLPPDGGEIVFRGEQLSDDAPPPGIFAVRPDGSGLREISTRPAIDANDYEDISVSPDGTRIGYRGTTVRRPAPVPRAGPANRSRPRAPVPGGCRPVRTALLTRWPVGAVSAGACGQPRAVRRGAGRRKLHRQGDRS